jgi:hypothetical protein
MQKVYGFRIDPFLELYKNYFCVNLIKKFCLEPKAIFSSKETT